MTLRLRMVILGSLLAASGAWALQEQLPDFPHQRHEGLFPLCQGCHGGLEEGREEDFFPPPERCASCHDGERQEPVEWATPSTTPSNLSFSHQEHARELNRAGEEADCRRCHLPPGSLNRMDVRRARPNLCLGCHAHEAPGHLAEGRDCRQCHLPLASAAELPTRAIGEFPTPAGHDDPGFIGSHAPSVEDAARLCATCHTEESCTRCHLNGEALPAILELAPDPRVAELVADKAPEYPEPESHAGPEWGWMHGTAPDAETRCANCHARQSCASCHRPNAPATVRALPMPDEGDPRGVRLEEAPLVHPSGFDLSHGARAASGEATCLGCHAVRSCESCHEGASKPAFHFGNYLQMHGPEAWGNEAECATCHNPEVFCRGCHEALGRGSQGRLDAAYHSNRAFWLFGHGTAARQGLESCRTCHSQDDCAVCHAAVGAWRINPHGPGFQADRLRDANPWSCIFCHRSGIPPR